MAIKKILVIRFRRVGDALLSSALCTSLRKTFPQAQIHYVLNKEIAPLFENHPDIDKVIPFSKEEISSYSVYLKKVKSIMKTGNYDIIIDNRATIKTLFFSLFSLKTKYRIGRKKTYNRFLHNYRIKIRMNGTRSMLSATLDLLDPLNKEFKVIKDDNFTVFVSPKEKQNFRQYMQNEGIDFNKPVIICAIACRLEYKMWDKSKMLTVLSRILTIYPDFQLILNYGNEREKIISTEIYEALNTPSNIFINVEAKDLRELPAMLANSDFFFGIEGGTRHMAQALHVPAFAIYPPNVNLVDWLPNPSINNQGISINEIDAKLESDTSLDFEEKYAFLTVDVVWNKLNKMLENLHPKK